MFYLDGLCRMKKLMDNDEYDEGVFDEKLVRAVYKSFRLSLASSGLRKNTSEMINRYIGRIELETGILFPEDWK